MEITHEKITEFIKGWIEDEIHNFKNFNDMLNEGLCADLATNIWEHFGKSSSINFHSYDDPYHVWVEFEGLHFDMQNPEGVKDRKEMKYFN